MPHLFPSFLVVGDDGEHDGSIGSGGSGGGWAGGDDGSSGRGRSSTIVKSFAVSLSGAKYVKSTKLLESILDLGHIEFTLVCSSGMLTNQTVTRRHGDFKRLYDEIVELRDRGFLTLKDSNMLDSFHFPNKPLSNFSVPVIAARQRSLSQFLDMVQAMDSDGPKVSVLNVLVKNESVVVGGTMIRRY